MDILRVHWDRALAVGAVLAGGLALLLGWVGVSGAAYLTEQLPYVISGGLVGMALVLVGASTWLSADVRDEWRKLDALESQLARIAQLPESDLTAEATPAPAQRRRSPRAGALNGDA